LFLVEFTNFEELPKPKLLMRKFYTLAIAALFSYSATANEVELIVEKVDNQNAVPGHTFRVYVHVPSSDYSVHAIWGDAENPIIIESTAPFYQHPFGMHTSAGIHENVIASSPELKYDSYVSLGYTDANANSLWEIGIDFTSFNQGGEIMTGNGAWFLLPENEKCQPTHQNLIFIGQFTTAGTATGVLNVQGWKGNKEGWSLKGLRFNSSDAKVFGCTDANSSNYNPNASFDDGSCEVESASTALSVAEVSATGEWNVFPNPVRDNLIHIQFSGKNNWSTETIVEFFDLSGKRVSQMRMSQGTWSGQNRFSVSQQLSAGTYKIVLTDGSRTESKTLIVSK